MAKIVKLLLLAVAATCVVGLKAQTGQTSREKVLIEGAKHPEEIPEWLAWQSTFRTLRAAKKASLNGFTDRLRMAEPERQTIYREVDAQADREGRCRIRVQRLEADMRGASVEAVKDAQLRAEFDYRQDVLAARDRLLATLSDDARDSLLAFVAEQRRSISVSIAPAELQRFRYPQ